MCPQAREGQEQEQYPNALHCLSAGARRAAGDDRTFDMAKQATPCSIKHESPYLALSRRETEEEKRFSDALRSSPSPPPSTWPSSQPSVPAPDAGKDPCGVTGRRTAALTSRE
mmetsp:Transcript_45457/g.105016  ORF Transcript_45457/g.105016 Transcript_45457/m.105016 type:complete len:113 (+) Transcript_45457:534-872(+)